MQFTLRYLTIIFCFSLFYTEKGFSQTYNFQSYSVKQGIPSSQILSIYQDNLGFMWFGTHGGGVCKFDGKKFITYTVNDSLGSNYVYSIGQDNSGHLLFATDNGLSVFNGKTIRNIRIPQGLPDNWVWKILKASDGKIWLGTKKGVCYMENGIIKNIPAINGDSSLQQNTIFNIYEDVKKNIWFCTKRAGIKSIQNNSLVSYTQNQGLSMNAVFCAGEDANNNLLIGTFKGLDKVINQTIENTRDPNLGAMIRITGIVKDNFNNLWLTTPTGLFYKTINATTFKQITVSGGLPSEILTALYKDAEGNLWIGTDGGGIAKFSSLKFINYNRKDSLPSDYINAIKILDNKVLIGTNFGGMIFNKEEKIYKTFKRPLTFSANQMIGSKVASIEADSSLIYFGTQNGLSVYDGKKFTNYDTASGLKVNN
ncbi:MAG: hypothetical protein IT239_01480, partial [Bacteroidia bacterium]|nr:hypothetical protein [Bacteroidia bacterium]